MYSQLNNGLLVDATNSVIVGNISVLFVGAIE